MENFVDFISTSTQNTDYKILPLAGDASSRSYYRVVANKKSFILMSWEPFEPESYPFLQVTELFSKYGVNVPEIISVSGSKGLMLLEDLGDLTLERKFWEFQDHDLSMPYYEKAIDELIKIQFQTQKEDNKSCCAFTTKFDHDKFMWEFNYTFKYLIKGLLGFDISSALDKELDSECSQISSALENLSTHISHRDYHSRNLMIKLGELKVIDYQDARLGPLQYDLVSLLHDSYVTLSSDNQSALIKYYKNHLTELKHEYSSDEFDHNYKLQTIQRCFKACGSFSSFYCTREDKRYLKYLNKTLATVHSELKDMTTFNTLKTLIEDSGALEKDYNSL